MPDTQNMEFPGRTLGSHLSFIHERQEESERRESRPCLFPPISRPLSKTMDRKEPDRATLCEEQRRRQEMCLLAELARIEQELRERLRREKECQELQEQVRQEENRQRWRSFCYMSLSQRINKPWVFSFYKNFPMHIYCQPIRSTSHGHCRRKKKAKR